MRPTVFQRAELRDENDNIIQQGTYGKGSALSNSTNDGWIDYVMNNLEFLYGLAKDEVVPVSALPASGDMNKTYLLTTNGKTYRWSGTEWIELTNSEAVGRAETAANLAEQWATKTDGTVADNEYSAKYYANAAQQSADDAQDVADDMADHLVQIDQNTGGVSANSKRIGNIEKLLQGNLYDYDTDDDTAYTKSVPAGAMPYAGLEKVGGKTVIMNQLAYNGNFNSISGWSVTDPLELSFSVADNIATVEVISAVGGRWRRLEQQANSLPTGHKIMFFAEVKCDHGTPDVLISNTTIVTSSSPTAIGDGWYRYVYHCEIISGNHSFQFCIGTSYADYAVGDKYYIRNVNAFDLTLMFGSGNEPSTVAEFEAMFPASYYAYNAGTLLSAGVTEVVSQGYNLFDKSTAKLDYFINGNNISAPATDFAHSDYIPVMPGQTYYFSEPKNSGQYRWFEYDENKNLINNFSNPTTGAFTVGSTTRYVRVNLTKAAVNTCVFNVSNASLNGTYKPYKAPIQYPIPTAIRNLDGYGWSCPEHYNYIDYEAKKYVQEVGSRAYASGDESDSTVITDSTTTYYPLTTAVETDISAYLTDDNLIQVEAGGMLTFENQHGDDYRIPVPSEEEYMIDLQSAIGG